MSMTITILILLIAWTYLWLQRGENPVIPKPTSANGGVSRIIAALLFIALVGVFATNAIQGGLTPNNLAITVAVILVTVALYARARRKQSK